MPRLTCLAIVGLLACTSWLDCNVKAERLNAGGTTENEVTSSRLLGEDVQDADTSKVFDEIKAMAEGSQLFPGSAIRSLSAPVLMIVNSAQDTISLPPRHAFGGYIYNVDGTVHPGKYWEAPSAQQVEIKRAANRNGLEFKDIKIAVSRMGVLKSLHDDGFWFAVAAFTEQTTQKSLFVVTSRGSQGITEWVADIGLFEGDVKKNTSLTLQTALWAAKGAVKAMKLGVDLRNLPWQQTEEGEVQLVSKILETEFAADKSEVDALFNINGTTSRCAQKLSQSIQQFSEAVLTWSKGGSDTVFGGWSTLGFAPHYAFAGLSLGGAVSTLVGLDLKHKYKAIDTVAGFSMNSPGIEKMTTFPMPTSRVL